MSRGDVLLSERATRLHRRGRLWFFADDLQGGADSAPAHGALVRMRGSRGEDLGLGLYSQTSRLALRACGSWGGDVPEPEEWFHRQLAAAIARREVVGDESGQRLVHGDADGLPGLVVDRYADCLVLQVTAAAVEHHLSCVVPWLVERFAPRAVIGRDDLPLRAQEGLEQGVRLLHGRRVEQVEFVEDGLRYPVQLWTGHKTGFYLDQRPARRLVRELARGRSVLDLFSYQGAFALAALQGGAREAHCVDQSRDALDRAAAAAAANQLPAPELERGNAFDVLRKMVQEQRRFGVVVVDPPAFAKSRRELQGGLRGYRDLNRRALRLLEPGGWLLTCSCSHHVTLPTFEDVVRQASQGLPFRLVLRRRIQAGDDHPVVLNHPESEYLKVLLLQRQED